MRLLAVLAMLGACGSAGPTSVCGDQRRGPITALFGDITGETGIAFDYQSPDFRSGALAAADLDGDGRSDVIAARRTGGVAVFHNLGDMQFAAIDVGIDPTIAASAIAAADLDNDGDVDLVLAGADHAHVLANRGDGTFAEVASWTGTGTTEQILPVDLDGDGLLDLVFVDRELPLGEASDSRLYLNHAGLQLALAGTIGTRALSWTATAFDVDGDGDQDLYIANDTLIPDFGPGGLQEPTTLPPDVLLRNDGLAASGGLQLTDVAAAMGLATPRSSMGGTLGDFDGDGQLDLYVPNLGANKLFVRQAGAFADQAVAFAIDATFHRKTGCGPGTAFEDCLLVSWSAVLTDFDLDGRDELLVMNGSNAVNTIMAPALLYVRSDDGPFHEVSPDLGCVDARALVATDLDGDGDADLLVAQSNGPLVVYENFTAPSPSAWLDVRLAGRASNRDGIGAVVTAHLASGRDLVKPVGAGGILNAAAPAEALFGLGSDRVSSLEVRWPSGERSVLPGPATGRVTIAEP